MTDTPPPSAPAPEKPSIRRMVLDLGPAGLLAAAWAVMPAVMGFTLLSRLTTVSDYLKGQGHAQGLAIYAGAFMLAAGLGLLPTYAQAILGGWCFGFAWGFPAALTGFFGAAMIGYFIARSVAASRTRRVIDTHPKAKVIRDALVGRGFWPTLGIVALLRLPPNSPFALTNLVMAGTGVPLPAFALGTLIGMAPRTGVAVFIAAGLSSLNKEAATRPPTWIIISGIVLTLVAIIVIGRIAQRALDRFQAGGKVASEEIGGENA